MVDIFVLIAATFQLDEGFSLQIQSALCLARALQTFNIIRVSVVVPGLFYPKDTFVCADFAKCCQLC